MRLQKFLFPLAGIGLLLLNFCSSDGGKVTNLGNLLTIEVTSPDLDNSYDVGETVNATVTFTSEAGLLELNYAFEVDGVLGATTVLTATDLQLDPNPTSGTVELSFDIDESLNDTNVTIYFEIVDVKNRKQEQQYSFIVEPYVAAAKFTNIILEAPPLDQTSKTFVATTTGNTYSADDVANQPDLADVIDFGFHSYSAGDISLLSISYTDANWYDFTSSGLNWTNRNRTLFILEENLVPADFDALDSEIQLQSLYAGSGTQDGYSFLAVNDVLSFETDESKTGGAKIGAIIIRAVVDSNDDGDVLDEGDYISIDITVQN